MSVATVLGLPHIDRNANEVGFVVEAKQYVLSLEGLPTARVNDLLISETGRRAIVQSLSGDRILALALDPGAPRAGERYTFLPHQEIYSLGDHLFGRVITVLGEPADGGVPFPSGNTPLVLDVDAPGIEYRLPIDTQLYTGITLIDTLLPIAKGQRQLMFGPVRGGKTQFLTDVIRHQARYDTVCIYAIIGKTLSELERVTGRILGPDTKGNNIVIAALSDQSSPRIMIAPSVAMLIAGYFQKQGRDVLVVMDDLDMHAKYLREIALLENRLPGRESYPGDLFYEHAHLMECCGRFGPELGGGTISMLPVIETDPYAALGLVSTNLMSCTDGHLSFVANLQAEGIYPAIAEEQSITRVGRSAQHLLQKELSSKIRTSLEAARREQQFAQFGGTVSSIVEATLHQGDIIAELLHQDPGQHIPTEVQVPYLTLALTPFLIERDVPFVNTHKRQLAEGLETSPEFKELRDLALSDMTLEKYQPLVEAKIPQFQKLCQS
jgi:F-type H+-transporting ATPase subunit alpha